MIGPTPSAPSDDLEQLEIELLLEGMYRRFGYDFRHYALSSLRRRIRERVLAEQLTTVSGLKERVLHDHATLQRLLRALSINVSGMFRDPAMYRAFRRRVVPLLRTYPFIRIWHAGCSTGEEVYSMAILLEEEGLYDRTRLYATDMNESVLQTAKEGIYPLRFMKQYTSNYQDAGGTQAFSEYYTANCDAALLRPALRRNIVFAQHNLAVDGSFNEFHVIACRNVMIYFDEVLQERVHGLFVHSLAPRGFLCVGARETLTQSSCEDAYEPFDSANKIYRRVR